MEPYQGHRRRPIEAFHGHRIADREERLQNIAASLARPAGSLLTLVAALAPGPAGTALKAILGAFDELEKRQELEEDRQLKAEVLALRQAVAALEELAEPSTKAPEKVEEPAPQPDVAVPTAAPVTPPEPAPAATTPLGALLDKIATEKSGS